MFGEHRLVSAGQHVVLAVQFREDPVAAGAGAEWLVRVTGECEMCVCPGVCVCVCHWMRLHRAAKAHKALFGKQQREPGVVCSR